METRSRIPNPKSKIPSVSAVYFPFTFISPSLLETLYLCFRRVVLYRPAGSAILDTLQPWVEQGSLDVRVPFEGVIDRSALSAELNTLGAWGLMHQDADLAYLKTVGNQIAPAAPLTPKIASEIKGTADKSVDKFENRALSIQLFLRLAQDFDQLSLELREQLNRFKLQHQALQTFFRLDNQESEEQVPAEPFVGTMESTGDFLIEKRMAAWNHLFQKNPAKSPVLLTDSPSAHFRLIDHVQDKIEVLKFEITHPTAPSDEPPWKDHLDELFHTLLTTQWTEQLQQHIEQQARQLDKIIESWKKSVTKAGEKIASFHWYVLPNQDPCSLLNQRCGLEIAHEQVGRAKNTVVGLVEHRP